MLPPPFLLQIHLHDQKDLPSVGDLGIAASLSSHTFLDMRYQKVCHSCHHYCYHHNRCHRHCHRHPHQPYHYHHKKHFIIVIILSSFYHYCIIIIVIITISGIDLAIIILTIATCLFPTGPVTMFSRTLWFPNVPKNIKSLFTESNLHFTWLIRIKL